MQFEMILEGARQLDVARTNLSAAEQKETKVSTSQGYIFFKNMGFWLVGEKI